MVTDVIKKDGTKVPFDVEKIKSAIMAASSVTDLSDVRKNEIVEQVVNAVLVEMGGKTEVSTTEIKNAVLAKLDSVEPSVSAAWREYDQENK